MSVEHAPPAHFHLRGRQEKRYIIKGAMRVAGKREEKEIPRKGLATTRGRHWPMVPGLNTGLKFARSPQPRVHMRAVPRWNSELDETGSWPGRSRPSSAASSLARPRSAGSLPRGAFSSAQASSSSSSVRQTSGALPRQVRPGSAASAERSAARRGSRDGGSDGDVQPANPDQLLREYQGWKSGTLPWQAPPAKLQEATNKMAPHSLRCMCSRCLGYQPHGLTRLLGAAYR